MEEARLVRLDARVEEEHEGRLRRLTDAEGRGWNDIVRAVEELRTALPVQSLAKLVDLAVVVSGYIILEVAQVTLGFPALGQPGEVRIDIRLASRAAERSVFAEVNEGHLARALSVVVLRRLRQWLYHEAERDSTLFLHLHVSRGLLRCSSHEPRGCLPLIDGDLGHGRCGWELGRGRSELDCFTRAGLECIEMFERTRQRLFRRWLALAPTCGACRCVVRCCCKMDD